MSNVISRVRKISSLVIAPVSFVMLTSGASAQGFLPAPIQNILNLLGPEGGGTSEFIQSRVSSLLLIFLGVIILAAVVYTAFAALKYIRSQGEEGEIESAQKAIKAIFEGIAMMLIAIVGIVLIFVFFGAQLFGTALYQTCISAPNSEGCNACNDPAGGLPSNWGTLKFKNVPSYSPGDASSLCTVCEYGYFSASRTNKTSKEYFNVKDYAQECTGRIQNTQQGLGGAKQ